MRNLLSASDRDRLLATLANGLGREFVLDGKAVFALAAAEDAHLFEFRANARAAELLLQPGIRDAMPEPSDALLDFLLGMGRVPVTCRHAASAVLELRRDDPRDFELLTPFHRFSGDLSAGMVRQQLRRPGGGASAPVRHTGNLVEFRIGRHRACLDVEDAINAFGIERHPGRIVLWHESALRAPGGWLRAAEVKAGRVRYAYEVAADSPLLRLTATLTAATRLAGARVTTALDGLDSDGLAMAALRLRSDGHWRDVEPPVVPGLVDLGAAVSHLGLGAAGWPAALPAIHLRPAAPAGVMSAKAVAERPGRLHWVLLRHGPRGLGPGGSLVAEETRLLLDGTGAEAAARAMAEPMPGLDLDPAPLPGAALHAAALAVMFDASGAWTVPLAPARREALAGWLSEALPPMLAAPASLADLTEAVLAAQAWCRAGGVAPDMPMAAEARLLARQDASGLFREPDGLAAGPIAQALALRALAHAADAHLRPGLGSAIARGLSQLSVRSGAEGVVLANGLAVPPLDHAEALAQLARTASAVVLATGAGRLDLPPEALAAARELYRSAIAMLRPLIRARDGRLEVLPAPSVGAVSPAAQAGATLALLAPETRTLGAGVAAAGRLPA